MKVRIDCWWTNSRSITDRVIEQFVTNPSLLDDIEFVFDNSYDKLIVFGRPGENTIIEDPSKVFCFTMEPLWSNNNSVNLHEISNFVWVPDKGGYANSDSYKEGLTYMLYGGHGELGFSESEYNWTFSNIIGNDYQKTKLISNITRNSYETHLNYKTELYQTIYTDRVQIAEHLINNNLPIDIYGLNWNSTNKQVKGPIWNKMLGLRDYKFSIASENTIQKNYISEKFWDVILMDTVPIYFGCLNFSEHIKDLEEFNFTSIVKDKKEIEYRLKNIIKDENLLYKKYLPIVKSIKQEYFLSKQYNIFLKIKELISL